MVNLDIPANVTFTNGQSVSQYFKTFSNFMKIQCLLQSDKPFTRYYTNGVFDTLTYSQVDHIATNLACKWAEVVEGTDVISYIGDYGVNYLIVMLAILKLRITLMNISPRNSEAADINLLEKTQSKVLMADIKYETIATSIADQVAGVKVIVIDPLDITTLVQEPLNPNHNNIINNEFSDEDITKSALIIHSSGSTGFPKPRYISNRYLFNALNNLHYTHIELNENDTFLSCTPLFHIFGFFAIFTMATVGGKVVFLEKLPASQSEIDIALTQNNCTAMCATPLIFEEMIPYLKEKNDFSNVKRLKIVLFAGAPLKHEAGEWLQNHGVNIRNHYGSTETGPFMVSDYNPENRNWLSLRPYLKDTKGSFYGVFETDDKSDPDVKHLYIRGDSPTLATGIANREDGGYDTNDLFKENPQYPGFYDYIGRRDDLLIMKNGEKTNPVPMESTIRQCNIVKQAAVLGHGRECTAALIQIDSDYSLQFTFEEVISLVGDAVKEANKECPSHSTILPEMIKILPLDKHLPTTAKGTVMRKNAESDYQDIVNQLYKDFLDGPSNDKTFNKDISVWSTQKTKDFLVNAVSQVLRLPKSTFNDYNQSIFDHGLNSLLSIQLCNYISEYFESVSQNFLYEHTSISSMCEALMKNCREDTLEQNEKHYIQTQKLAEAYIRKAKKDFPIITRKLSNDRPSVILLTGVTGSIGSFMLRDLLLDKSVNKVYALVRGREEELMNRLVNAFESRSLDSCLLEDDRLEVLPMGLNDFFLGLSREKYDQLKKEVTIVQHCAWSLDFNMNIDFYDKDCISPFYNLLQFAYDQVNPMRVHFISSVSASASYGSNVIEEEPLPFDSYVCMPMGYAQSKFVVEMLLNYLTTEKNFPCYIERLGQVYGDSINGVWNMSEQYPLMFVGGGSVMHKMPALDANVIDWIPVDYAASSIVDIMLRTANLPINEDEFIFHIVNPHTIAWNDVLLAMKDAGMTFDIVSTGEWLEELAKDDTNPAYKLIDFYKANLKGVSKMPIWDTKKTCTITQRISKSPVLNSSLFKKILQRWELTGFYDQSR